MDLASIDVGTIIVWVLIGLAAGWLASLVVGGGGLVRYLLSGLIGSIIGGALFSALGWSIPIDIWWVREILVAAVGALIVIIVAKMIA